MPRVEGQYPEYHISDIDESGATKYYGYVTGKGQWYIMQVTSTAVRYAKGDTGYTTNWTNRASSVSYDYFNTVF
jgi:hypothetical protein